MTKSTTTTVKSPGASRSSEFKSCDLPEEDQAVAKGGVACPFPWRLHECLAAAEKEGLEHIVAWKPHGRAFCVSKPEEFVKEIMPRFFGMTRYTSFQRQLNLYGFSRFFHGKDKGSYYNLSFVREKRSLAREMVRSKIKGTKSRRTPNPWEEPDFYRPEWKQQGGVAAAAEPPLQRRRQSPLGGPPSILRFVGTDPSSLKAAHNFPPNNHAFRKPLSLIRAVTCNDFQLEPIIPPQPAVGPETEDVDDDASLFDGLFMDDEMGVHDIEPVPLREEAHPNESPAGAAPPSFKLVDPILNIYSL